MLTDHEPLVSPFNPDKKLRVYTLARLQGWAITLMTSNTVQQINIGSNADGLSRIPARPDPVFENLVSGSQTIIKINLKTFSFTME